ncbi:hypothetical protein K402DRAFT_454405 [Aulographum hederae CBS 113979]|uniref:Potassium channel tetramerisation-type BTB domain-containing protein n=1 Tax=Aulographum hederae CBS 113979 TaxID=1176131 RepID=A0A6G1GZS0_9PEZI|nr:hypothetical protein K402DRAFT_454405 [Aulographum hederae CBS 113979]
MLPASSAAMHLVRALGFCCRLSSPPGTEPRSTAKHREGSSLKQEACSPSFVLLALPPATAAFRGSGFTSQGVVIKQSVRVHPTVGLKDTTYCTKHVALLRIPPSQQPFYSAFPPRDRLSRASSLCRRSFSERMPNPPTRGSSRDLTNPATDRASTSTSAAEAPPSYASASSTSGRNDLESTAISDSTSHNISTPSIVPTESTESEAGIRRGVSVAPSVQSGRNIDPTFDYTNYGYTPGGPLVWDWTDPVNLPDYQPYFEPQGELLNELQNQQSSTQDFSPHPPFPTPQVVTQFPNPFLASQPRFAQPALPPIPRFPVSSSASATPTPSPVARSAGPSPSISQMPTQTRRQPPPPPVRVSETPGGTKRKARTSPSSLQSPTQATSSRTVGTTSKRVNRPREAPGSAQASSSSQTEKRSVTTRSQAAVEAPQAAEVEDPGTDSDTPIVPSESPPPERAGSTGKARVVPDVPTSALSSTLPAGKVFPIQIGPELFRLSGASLSSDAPSYFSQFFGEQLLSNSGRSGSLKTLYIDRDPNTFRDISLHLQGYYVKPSDGAHFVRLFADAQFYSLPRLTQQLFKSEIHIQIGNRHFQIPRDIFSAPGDSPNFFSLGFAHFFSTPSQVFPGLDRATLLRPPAIHPPALPGRCAETFDDILKLLQGYPVDIRDQTHRANLLRDARYFHLKGLEQKLLPVDISYNLARERSEILMRLEDIRQSGISFVAFEQGSTGSNLQPPNTTATSSSSQPPPPPPPQPSTSGSSKPASPTNPSIPLPALPPPTGYIHYARPYTDSQPHVLILEISPLPYPIATTTPTLTSISNPNSPTLLKSESATLDPRTLRLAFAGQTKARISSLFSVVASKLALPTAASTGRPLGVLLMEGRGLSGLEASPANSGVSGEKVRCTVGRDAFVVVDGVGVVWGQDGGTVAGVGEDGEEWPKIQSWGGRSLEELVMKEWVLVRSQWRLRVGPKSKSDNYEEEEGEESDDDDEEEDENEEDERIVEVSMEAVRIEAYTAQRYRNSARAFLG